MTDVPRPPLQRRDIVAAVAIFLIAFLVYGLSPNATPYDSRWTVYTAMSILEEGNTHLNEYLPQIEADNYYMMLCVTPDYDWKLIHSGAECEAGDLYNFYPVAVPTMAVPVIAVMRAGIMVAQPVLAPVAERIPSEILRKFLAADFLGASPAVEIFVASLFLALAAVVCYFTAREFLGRPQAVLIAGMFAFCTPAWSLASRALWQHGPSILLLSVVLLMAVRGGRNPVLIGAMGAPLALAFFVRASNALPAVVFAVYVWHHHRKQLVSFLLSVVPVAVLFDLYNVSVFGSSLAPYSWVQRGEAGSLELHSRFLEALAGNLISPGRGLLVYVPIAFLSIYGMTLRPPSEKARALRPYLIGLLVMHWILVSTFNDWVGGHSYGARYMADMTPILIFFLIPVMDRAWSGLFERRFLLPATLALLALISFGIHSQGATRWACWDWNVNPTDINASQERVWDWRDPAFLRGVRGGPPGG